MNGRAERRRLLVACGIVLLAAIGHRATLFRLHRGDLDALIDANAAWYTFQHLPREMLRDHLFRSLLLLQQTPPISNLLLGVVLKWCSCPFGVAYAMIGLQTLVSVLTAVVLVHVVSVLYPRRVVLWTAIGLLFVLDTDLVVLEYNSLGQTIYGPLAMLFLLVLVDRLTVLRQANRLRDAAAAGVAMGLLVLTRSPWSLFPLPCLLLVAALARARKARAVVACLVPIVVLQGGWALKNYAVYGVLSPMTSSWSGLYATVGLQTAGFDGEYRTFLEQRAVEHDGHPEWVLAFLSGDPAVLDRLPPEIGEHDREIEHAMGLSNPAGNTLRFRTLWTEGERLFLSFVRRHPREMLAKWAKAYRIFWQPMANYGRMFVALFAVDNRIASGLDFADIVGQLRAGTLPETQYVTSGTHRFLSGRPVPPRFTPSSMHTLPWLDPFVLMLNVLGVHLLLPLVGVMWLARRLTPAVPAFDPLRMAVLLVAASAYAYLAVLANLFETLENMRYRQDVEPVIWLITLISMTALAGLARRIARAAGLPSSGTTFQAGVSGPAGSASIDTNVRLNQPTSNSGTDVELFFGVTNAADKVYRTFMAFQLAGIPAGAVVSDCRLTINVTQRSNPTAGHIRRLCGEHWLDGDGQGEAQATWSNWRTATAWGTAGAGSTASCATSGDYTTVGEVAYTPPAGTGLFTFPNMAALCQDALAARSGWLRLRISQDSEATQSNLIRFDSSDADTAANRPRLVVTWSVP